MFLKYFLTFAKSQPNVSYKNASYKKNLEIGLLITLYYLQLVLYLDKLSRVATLSFFSCNSSTI